MNKKIHLLIPKNLLISKILIKLYLQMNNNSKSKHNNSITKINLCLYFNNKYNQKINNNIIFSNQYLDKVCLTFKVKIMIN